MRRFSSSLKKLIGFFVATVYKWHRHPTSLSIFFPNRTVRRKRGRRKRICGFSDTASLLNKNKGAVGVPRIYLSQKCRPECYGSSKGPSVLPS